MQGIGNRYLIHYRFIKFVNNKVCYQTYSVPHMKSVIISGGSKGLGKALSNVMGNDGWKVLTFSRSIEESGNEPNGSVFTMRADLRLDRDIVSVVNRANMLFGKTDLLILNAGTIMECRNVLESTVADLRRLFEVNVFANYYLMRTFLEANPNGTVVHVTSDAARQHFPGWGVYGASKAVMDFLIEAVAAEEGNLKAFSIDPGDMDTEMHRIADSSSDREALQSPEAAALKFYEKLKEVLRIE